jgi:RNA polymerase sigma factor (sigma-70 family)
MDQVLEPFLASTNEDASEEQLGDLLARHAAPVVRRVVSSRLGNAFSDVEDVASQVLLQLMLRLRREKADANLAAIDAFASYAAAAAHHGCDHYLRAKYPLRWRLRNRIRYVLEHDARFAVWKMAEGSWVCGRAEWRSRPASGTPPAGDQLAGIPMHHARELLARVFQLSNSPHELNAVVEAAAAAWDIPQVLRDDAHRIDAVPDIGPRADATLEQRGRLDRIWTQIRDLPLRQRHAILLNLRDDAITLFLTTGAASMREIAASLELPVEDFAALWNDLPLPDNAVAARLGCTRQQVINLRMAARKRLAHRLGEAS